MKTLTTLFAVIAALAVTMVAPAAYAADWYGSLAVSADPHEWEDVSTTYTIQGAVGMYFSDNLRGEIEYTYLPSQEFNRDDALFANAYYDFGPRLGITPFVLAGVGVGLQGIDIEQGLGQVGAGFSIPVSDHVAFTTTYQYRVGLRGLEEVGQAVLAGIQINF
jgi:opacity protein-like surface antigen